MEQKTVIIVGGGIAGLVAARELSAHYRVIIIEANEMLGGRIHDYTGGGFTTTIAGGPEFIHGKTTHTIKLLKEAGITYQKLTGKFYRSENGQWQEQDEMVEHWDALMKQMKAVKEDMTLYDFLQKYYGADQYAKFRQHITSYTEGFDLADVKQASIKALYDEWVHEDDQYRVDGGYSKLINYLANDCKEKGCEIITNSIVKQIDWERDDVTVYTNDDKKYYGEKCIVTIPISILQKDMGKMAVNITPAPHDYIAAARHVGFGAVIKVVLRFDKAFWQSDTGFILSREVFPTWWPLAPDTTPVLTGWVGGPNALDLSNETDGNVLGKALLSISNIFTIPVAALKERLQAHKIFNWQHNEGSLGGYSYATPESAAARKLLNTPLDNTLFFAGEGLYEGQFPGTVEAAVINAQDVVKRVIAAK